MLSLINVPEMFKNYPFTINNLQIIINLILKLLGRSFYTVFVFYTVYRFYTDRCVYRECGCVILLLVVTKEPLDSGYPLYKLKIIAFYTLGRVYG